MADWNKVSFRKCTHVYLPAYKKYITKNTQTYCLTIKKKISKWNIKLSSAEVIFLSKVGLFNMGVKEKLIFYWNQSSVVICGSWLLMGKWIVRP